MPITRKKKWHNLAAFLYMYSADSDGLHMDVYLVGLHILECTNETVLGPGEATERKLGNRDRCILSKDHTEVRIFHLHRLIAAQI